MTDHDNLLARIDATLDAGEPHMHGYLGDQACRWCDHDWHGMPCQPAESWRRNTTMPCDCDTSLRTRPLPRDGAWLPLLPMTPQGRITKLMHETGLDGYAAAAQLRLPLRRPATLSRQFRARMAELRERIARESDSGSDYVRIGPVDEPLTWTYSAPDAAAPSEIPPGAVSARSIAIGFDGWTEIGRIAADDGIIFSVGDLFYRDDRPIRPLREPVGVTFTMTDEQVDAWRRLVGGVRSVVDEFSAYVRHSPRLRVTYPADGPAPAVEDTVRRARMDRALEARRNRGTGPPRPTANQAHRPRRERR